MKNLIDELGRTESLSEKTKIIGEIKTLLTNMPGGKRTRKSQKHQRTHKGQKHPRSKHQRSKHQRTHKGSKHPRSKHQRSKKN